MSDIFEQDIDKENEDLSSLEDDNITVESDGHFIFPDELYKLKLEYSNEGIYATIPEGMELKETDSIKKLMKNMNLTIDQAMNALEVPEDKREKYRKTITPDN